MGIKGALYRLGINVHDNNVINMQAGLQVQGVGVEPGLALGRGQVYFYDPTNGDSANSGERPNSAVDTLAAAVALCTADRGDTVVCLPGTEVVTAAVVPLAGTTLLGVGATPLACTITADVGYTTAGVLTLSADDVRVVNMGFSGAFTTGGAVAITGDHAVIQNCHFFFDANIWGLSIGSSAETRIFGCYFADLMDYGIGIVTGNTDLLVKDCISYVPLLEAQGTNPDLDDSAFIGNVVEPNVGANPPFQFNSSTGLEDVLIAGNYLNVANGDAAVDETDIAAILALGIHLIGNNYEDA